MHYLCSLLLLKLSLLREQKTALVIFLVDSNAFDPKNIQKKGVVVFPGMGGGRSITLIII